MRKPKDMARDAGNTTDPIDAWTRKGHWTRVHNKVATDAGISAEAFRVYFNLAKNSKWCQRMGETIQRCRVSEEELAEAVGSSERSVKRSVQELVQRGLISRLRVKYEASITYIENPAKLYDAKNGALHEVTEGPEEAPGPGDTSLISDESHKVHLGPDTSRSLRATFGPATTLDSDVEDKNQDNVNRAARHDSAALPASLPADVEATAAGEETGTAILPADVGSARVADPSTEMRVVKTTILPPDPSGVQHVEQVVVPPMPPKEIHLVTPEGAAPTLPLPMARPDTAIVPVEPPSAPAPIEQEMPNENPFEASPSPMPNREPKKSDTDIFQPPRKSIRLDGDPGTAILTTRSVVKVGAPSGSVAVDVDDPKTAKSLWYRFQKAVVENVPNYTPPARPTSRELGNCKKLLQEYSVKDLLETFRIVANRWVVVQEMWPKVARSPVPDFYSMFTLRRELVAIVQSGKGLTTRTHRYDPNVKTPAVGWGDALDSIK